MVEDVPRAELDVINISGSPQISDAMIHKANMLEGHPCKGPQGMVDIYSFLDRVELDVLGDAIRLGNLPVPKKTSSSGIAGSSSSFIILIC